MKKMIFAICLLVTTGSFAQTEKGSVMVGGNFGFRTGDGSNEFRLTPDLGFFVARNFAVGANLGYASTKNGNIRNSSFNIGPFARYYFGPTTVKPFLHGSVGFQTLTVKTATTKTNTNGFGFLFGMGFAAFINEAVAFEGTTGYNYSKFKNVDGSGGFALNLGFQIYLTKKSRAAVKSNVLGQ
jgi:hypothetical protein